MGEVLIDNWNLTKANLSEKKLPNQAFSDLLSAIVLWDEVYYLDDGFATFGWLGTSEGQKLKSVLKPLKLADNIKQAFINSADIIYEREVNNEQKRIVAQRALLYHEISKAYGYNYFPIKERAEFLRGFKPDVWNRDKVLKKEEREILKRIDEFDSGKESFIQFPILASLIVKNADGNLIDTALDIKGAKEVKRFREYMDKIDKAVNEGNYCEARYVLSLIPDIVNEIEKMDRTLRVVTQIMLKTTPCVVSTVTGAVLSNLYPQAEDVITLGFLCLTVKEILEVCTNEFNQKNENKRYPKRVQLSFLRTLGKEYLNK